MQWSGLINQQHDISQCVPPLVAQLKQRVVALRRPDLVAAFLRSSPIIYPEHNLPQDVEALAGSESLLMCSEDALDSLGMAWGDINEGYRLSVHAEDPDSPLMVAYFTAAYMFLVLRGSNWWMHMLAGVELIQPLQDYCAEVGLNGSFVDFIKWWCSRLREVNIDDNIIDLDVERIERRFVRPGAMGN